MRRPLLAILLLLGLLALPASPAFSATSNARIEAILRDCEEDGSLEGSYRPSELRDAARNISTDLDQYSDCRDVISAAVLGTVSGGGGSGAGSGGGGGGGGATGAGGEAGTGTGTVDGGGTTVPSPADPGDGFSGSGALLTPAGPEEQEALTELATTPPAETVVAGRPLSVLGASDLGAIGDHQLPVPLIVALALLTAGGLVAGLPNLRRRILDRRAA